MQVINNKFDSNEIELTIKEEIQRVGKLESFIFKCAESTDDNQLYIAAVQTDRIKASREILGYKLVYIEYWLENRDWFMYEEDKYKQIGVAGIEIDCMNEREDTKLLEIILKSFIVQYMHFSFENETKEMFINKARLVNAKAVVISTGSYAKSFIQSQIIIDRKDNMINDSDILNYTSTWLERGFDEVSTQDISEFIDGLSDYFYEQGEYIIYSVSYANTLYSDSDYGVVNNIRNIKEQIDNRYESRALIHRAMNFDSRNDIDIIKVIV